MNIREYLKWLACDGEISNEIYVCMLTCVIDALYVYVYV